MPNITLEGKTLPLREHVSEKGNTSYVLAPKAWSTGRAFRGVPIPALSTELPHSVMFDEILVPLRADYTASGKPKTVGSASVTVDGEARTFTFQVSKTKDGWWVIAKAIPGGGGASQVSLDEF